MSEVASQPAVADGRSEPRLDRRPGDATEAQRVDRRTIGRRWWRDARRRRMLAVADLLAATAATGSTILIDESGAWPFLFLPLWLVTAKLLGLYDRDHRALRHLTADEVPSLIAWAASMTAVLALLLPLTPAGALGAPAAVANLVVAGLAAIVARSLARRLWWSWTPPEHVGLLGDDEGLESMGR
jgi:hypothetical protein